MKKLRVITVAVLITMFAVSNSYAIFGAGLHWGFDMSMGMENVSKEPINLGGGTLTLGELSIDANDLFHVSRMNWKSSPINFGGKVYIDIIPFIETIELSCNFGMWQYDGTLYVLDPLETASASAAAGRLELEYRPMDLTLKNIDGLSYIGLTGTPYAKLHFDATARKTILNLWLVKFSAGAGVSAHFATPLLSNSIIESALAIGSNINEDMLADLAADPTGASAKKIVQTIIDEALGKPALGMHFLLGVKGKLPVIPVGVYLDAKYMIPFSKFDKDAGDGINGFGLLVNAGISLSI
jgi:hypothetical protein